MTTTSIRARLFVAALAGLLLLAGGESVGAAEGKGSAIVTPLMTKDLSGIPSKELVMLTVEYLPGGASLPHRHDAQVFVYVLEGMLVTQVDGQDRVTLKPGQTFYEGPEDIHRTSANASATEPVKFLVFIAKEKGKPVSRPVPGN
jgi:quercetin dioxygenase-like cupin family protein